MTEYNILKNYRVLKTQDKEGRDIYYPQFKFLGLFWLYFDCNREHKSFESALDYIRWCEEKNKYKKPKVEYIEITEKDLNLPRREPNPPPLEP